MNFTVFKCNFLNFSDFKKCDSLNNIIFQVGLATLLKGAGYNFKVFECDFQKNIFLWCFSCKKLDNEYTRACVRSSGSSKLLLLIVNIEESVKKVQSFPSATCPCRL